MNKKTILVVGAHMDDCEIGAGGLIIKAVRKGHRVVLVNFASDYSTWCVTKGREKEVREKVLRKAKEMGVEKRFLGYGYQSVLPNIEAMRKLSEIVVDVKPDIALFHNRFETSPSDHGNVGVIAEHSVRSATRVLGCKEVSYIGEMYTYEVYLRLSPPYPLFQPDTYIDIADVIKETVENIDYFGREIYAGSPIDKHCADIQSKIKINYLGDKEISLWHYGEVKLSLSLYRGAQSGVRFAEAYVSLASKKTIGGKRILQEIVEKE